MLRIPESQRIGNLLDRTSRLKHPFFSDRNHLQLNVILSRLACLLLHQITEVVWRKTDFVSEIFYGGKTNQGLFRHKVGGAVAVARRAGAMNAIDSINHFFLNKEMILVGSSYWNIAYGRLSGDAMKDAEGVANMKNLGQNIAWLLDRLK